MLLNNREQERLLLEQELECEGCSQLFVKFQEDYPLFKVFSDWKGVGYRLTRSKTRNVTQDEMIPLLLEAHQESNNPYWPTIMLSLFWKRLERVWKRKRRWDTDSDELWQRIVREFLIVVRKLDPSVQPDRLMKRILNKTALRVYKSYQVQWRRLEREKPMEFESLLEQDASNERFSKDRMHARTMFDGKVDLKVAVKLPEITSSDMALLIDTRVHGITLQDLSQKTGVNYQTLKKRRLRLEARLRELIVL